MSRAHTANAQGSRARLQCGRERGGWRVYDLEEAAILDSFDCRLSASRPTIAPSGVSLWRARCPGRAEGARPKECRWADRAEAGGGRSEEGANGRLGRPWQALVQVRSVPATAMARPRQSRTHAAERGEIVRRVLTFILRFPLTTPSTKQPHVFRLHRSRVYYVRESLLRQAISVPRANLISLGVCLGKFSKTEKFRLHVTALDLMGKYAKNKVRSFSRVACLLTQPRVWPQDSGAGRQFIHSDSPLLRFLRPFDFGLLIYRSLLYSRLRPFYEKRTRS